MRNKIALDTMQDVANFVNITASLPGQITVTDGKGMCVNAKSLMGMIYALEFDELWLNSDNDIYSHISKFIVIE